MSNLSFEEEDILANIFCKRETVVGDFIDCDRNGAESQFSCLQSPYRSQQMSGRPPSLRLSLLNCVAELVLPRFIKSILGLNTTLREVR